MRGKRGEVGAEPRAYWWQRGLGLNLRKILGGRGMRTFLWDLARAIRKRVSFVHAISPNGDGEWDGKVFIFS